MKRLLVLCLVMLASWSAYAVDPIIKYYASNDPGRYDTLQGACSGIAAYNTSLVNSCARWPPNTTGAWSGSYSVKTMPTATDTTCVLTLNRTYCSNGNTISPSDYSYLIKSEVTCPAGYKMVDNACVSDCPEAGTSMGNMSITTGWRTGPDPTSAYATEYPSPVSEVQCNGTCQASIDSVSECSLSVTPEGGYYRQSCTYGIVSTGQTCTTTTDPNAGKTPPSAPPPEPNRCPRGTSQIGIDSAGIPICKGNTPVPTPPKTTQTETGTNSEGNPTSTTTETTTNSDGSTTTKTTTTTTNPDGSTTTTSNTTTSNASDGAPGESDEEVPDFCKSNPNLSVCKNSSISGTCGAVTCEGDAIQCAIAREVSKRACEEREAEQAIKDSPQHALGAQVMNGNDPLASTLPGKSNATSWAMPSSLDQSGWLGAGACFPDKQITVQGNVINIPFSQACQYLIVFRYVSLIIAAIVSFKMLSGVILKD